MIGVGESPKTGEQIVVHYTGKLENGTKFDSSRDRNKPFDFILGGRVIQGWNEGVATMKEGGKRKLIIPPELGYGSRNMGSIPPNSILFFDVELIDVMENWAADFSLPGKEEVTDSGLRMIIHKEGNGKIPVTGQTVSVHYAGYLMNGQKFDLSGFDIHFQLQFHLF